MNQVSNLIFRHFADQMDPAVTRMYLITDVAARPMWVHSVNGVVRHAPPFHYIRLCM